MEDNIQQIEDVPKEDLERALKDLEVHIENFNKKFEKARILDYNELNKPVTI